MTRLGQAKRSLSHCGTDLVLPTSSPNV
jgi:hypothetical protein